MGSFTNKLSNKKLPNTNIQPLNPIIFPTKNAENFDDILMDNNFVKPLSYKEILKIDRDNFVYWCLQRGVYQYPTIELLEWLKNYFNVPISEVLEIGAGNGAFSRYLGTKATDSKIQETPELKHKYLLNNITTTNPPDDVEKINAIAAIKKYKPKIVFGTYISSRFKKGDVEGFQDGVDHEKLWNFEFIRKYIMVGNIRLHKNHTFLKYKHEEYYEPWLISRSEQTLNRIFVWEK